MMEDINEVYNLLEEKENDLQLAAELGKALLEKNEALTMEYDRALSDHATQIERLKRENVWLRSQISTQSSELDEAMKAHDEDLQNLREQLKAKAKAFTERTGTMQEMTQLAEQNLRLSAELDKALDKEKSLKCSMTEYREQLTELTSHHKHLTSDHDKLEQSERHCIKKIKELESHTVELSKCNERLQFQTDQLHYMNDRLEKEKLDSVEQIRLGEKQVEILKEKNQELLDQLQEVANKSVLNSPSFLDELEENQKSLTSGYSSNLSLLEELDNDEAIHMLPIDNFGQLKMEVSEVYNELQSIIEELETSECASTPPKQRVISRDISNGELATAARHVKYLVTRRHQIGSLLSQIAHLKDEVKSQTQQIEDLEREATASSKESTVDAASLDKANKEKEEALELYSQAQEDNCKLRSDIRRLERELLETIQKKIKYSQQVEQWQLDMEEMVENQVRTMFILEKHNKQRPLKVTTSLSPLQTPPKSIPPETKQNPFTRNDTRRFSFFRRKAK